MEKSNPKIEKSWLEALQQEFEAPYFVNLKRFLLEEKNRYRIYPQGGKIFAAFDHTPFNAVKVVILGQDPYHGEGQAHGLCFSVPGDVPLPPSLQNIFKEIKNDLGIDIPVSGNLEKWAKQGVLLLNATLTVRAGCAGSHQGKGWELFTDQVIRIISERKENVVFLLWGNYAIAKRLLINQSKHHVLTAPHPSPLSVSRGFFGCRHFSKTNNLLATTGHEPIDWSLK
ncbi:MAG TPA: uracil-DNA glycosylase [Bacteroidales bacterium]|nr:uracil-DNA glycosylase [Bacteroidales bacterium]